MLNDLLNQLDEYNKEIIIKKKEIGSELIARITKFYRENKNELEEVDRLLEVAVTTEFEEKVFYEKANSLEEKLEESLKDIQVEINLNVGPFLLSKNSTIYKLEDKGYKLLFMSVGEILKLLDTNQNLNGTYWGGGADYVSRFFNHGKWKHLGLESELANPYSIRHILQM